MRVAGVNVGSVTDLTVNEDKRAVVTVELERRPRPARRRDDLRVVAAVAARRVLPRLRAGGRAAARGRHDPRQPGQQTVQPDLVANTMREPFRRRLTLLINEFGTALAGNPENLREAIRLGAPALTELEEVTEILAGQARS